MSGQGRAGELWGTAHNSSTVCGNAQGMLQAEVLTVNTRPPSVPEYCSSRGVGMVLQGKASRPPCLLKAWAGSCVKALDANHERLCCPNCLHRKNKAAMPVPKFLRNGLVGKGWGCPNHHQPTTQPNQSNQPNPTTHKISSHGNTNGVTMGAQIDV